MESNQEISRQLGSHVESIIEDELGRVTVIFKNGFRLVTDKNHIPVVTYVKNTKD